MVRTGSRQSNQRREPSAEGAAGSADATDGRTDGYRGAVLMTITIVTPLR